MEPTSEHPIHEALWKRAQERFDARLRPSDDPDLTDAALEACPDELEELLLLESALELLAEPRPVPLPTTPPPAPRRVLRLGPLLRPVLAAGLLASLALWSLRDGAPDPHPAATAPLHAEVAAGDTPDLPGLPDSVGTGRAGMTGPSIRSFSLTVTRTGPDRALARRPAILSLVTTRTHTKPDRP